MDHLEQENHKLREEVTTLRAENEILKNLVSLASVAQSQPLALPIVSTQAQTVASTTPISTVFASTPQHAMLEGYLWSTPLSASEILCPVASKVQTPFVQQSGPLLPQDAMTYSAPLVHEPIYQPGSVVAYNQVEELREKFDALRLELKALRGEEMFGESAYDLCLVPNVMIPPKFKVPDFEKYKGNTCPKDHLTMYARKMSPQVGNDKLLIYCFQDSLTGTALKWYTGLNCADVKTFKDLGNAFIRRYDYNLYLAPDRDDLQAMTQNDNESFKAYAQRWRDFADQVRPPLEEEELTKIFLRTLDQFYYEKMVVSAPSNFTKMMITGMRLEEGVREGRLVKENIPTEEEDHEMSVAESLPQQQYLTYHPVAAIPIINDVQSSGCQPQFQQCQQQPRQQASKIQIDPIPMTYADLFPKLLERNLVYTKAPSPVPAKLTSRYRPDLFCAFHQGAPGHDIEHCFALQKIVQKLIQKNLIPFEEFEFGCAS